MGDRQRSAVHKEPSAGFPASKPKERRPYPSKASPARLAALLVCCAVREREAYAQDLITTHIDEAHLTPQDRAFATRLVLGVVSMSGILDDMVDRALRSPTDVHDDVRDALRIATYEIMFLDKSPHAAVDQGVELTRSVQPRAAGLANAVLRKVVGMKSEFPFGDPARDIAALARLHAFPLWMTKRLVADLGPRAAISFMRASNEPPPLFVAVNEARDSSDEVYRVLVAAGGSPAAVVVDERPIAGCFRLSDARVLQDGRVKRLLAQGKMLVSDASSQAVAMAVLPAHMPASFLEIGAGRGTKTILLQSSALRRYGSQMELTAIDNHAFKTDLLRTRAQDYGVQVTSARTGDATRLSQTVGTRRFDAVFIDAPCTGLGTLRRHPEIRWRLTEQRVSELADLGLALLCSSAAHVAQGGYLAYATCTVTHAENNGVVKRFLESEHGADFALAPLNGRSCLSTELVPGSPDAHFAVRFVRTRV